MKIGLLLPTSIAHHVISQDFLDGLHSLLHQKNLSENITVIKESVGFGGTEKEVYAKAENLLLSEDVDILVAYIDEKVIGMLYSLVQATSKLMIVVNPGANIPFNWIAQPTVIHLNLNHAFLCRLTGALAAAGQQKEAVFATTFYDCGYLHGATMVNKFIEEGGTIQFNYINNQKYDEQFHINELLEYITANPGCNKILGLFDVVPAGLLYKILNEFKTAEPLNLFVSPMMLSDKAIKYNDNTYDFNIEGFLPWLPSSKNEQNQIFLNSCKRKAGIFSLLGWETGLVIAELEGKFKNDYQNGEAMIDHLKGQHLTGPRGDMHLDVETLHYLTPVAKYTLPAGSTDATVEWKTDITSEWQAFTAKDIEGSVAGWTNTYLCY